MGQTQKVALVWNRACQNELTSWSNAAPTVADNKVGFLTKPASVK